MEVALREASSLMAQGRHGLARDRLRSAGAQGSNSAFALALLGAACGGCGDHGEAVRHFEAACALDPGGASHWHNLGEARRLLGLWQDARAALLHALQLDPLFVPACESLVTVTEIERGLALARHDADAAGQSTSELAGVLNGLGNALHARGDAMGAVAAYRRALALVAMHATALSNLGNALRDIGQVSEAEAACREAVRLVPDFPEAWNNLGTVLVNLRRAPEAQACFARALQLRPGFETARHNARSGVLFDAMLSPQVDGPAQHALAAEWGRAQPAPQPPRRPARGTRPLRVGYISADFRRHAMLHFLEPVLAGHDPRRVEVFCYAQGPRADEETRRLMAYGHHWVWIHDLDDAALDARIRRDEIDILADCSGHTQGTRVAALARKPAPVMVSWLGFLSTTGLPAMDYRLTDPWVDPPGLTEGEHSEQLLRLAAGMLALRPHHDAPPVAPLPATRCGQVTFGSLGNLQKIHAGLVHTWAEVLHATPGSRMLLQTKLLADAGLRGWLLGLFEAHGIARHRLELRTHARDYLQTYADIDVALDTFPYGGGATTCDALWMGVPVVTLAGRRPGGRLSVSLLARIGRPQWIARDPADYVRIATGLAADLPSLQRERAALRQRVASSPLCDEADFVARLETLYASLVP